MKGKQIGILMAVMCVLLVGGAMAATTWYTPLANQAVTGATQFLNVSETTSDAVTNVTWYYKIGSGAWVLIGQTTNDTDGDVEFNITWSTTSITDQGSITLNATAWTGGGTLDVIFDSTVITGIDIDNTNPTSTFGSVTLSSGTNTENTSITIDTATDASIVNCTLTSSPSFNGNSTTSIFVAASGSKCIWQIDDIVDNSFGYYFTNVDGLNTSTSATRYVTIDTNEAKYIAPTEEVTTTGAPKKTNNLVYLIVIIAGIWIASKLWKK